MNANSIAKQFFQVVSKHGNRIAVEDCTGEVERKITYCELQKRADQLAGKIKNTYANYDFVFILTASNVLLSVAAFAAVSAHIPFLIGDEKVTPFRELEGSRFLSRAVIVTDAQNVPDAANVLRSDADGTEFGHDAFDHAAEDLAACYPVYLLQRLKLCGQPNLWGISQQSVLNYSMWRNKHYGISCHDNILQLLRPMQNGFYANLFSAFLSGAKLVFADPKNPEGINCFSAKRITHLTVTPSIFQTLVTVGDKMDFESLRQVAFTGETCNRAMIRTLQAYNPHVFISNEYGLAENGIATSINLNLAESELNNIGRPIPQNQILILDEAGKPVKPGEKGRLYLRGTALNASFPALEMESPATKFKLYDGTYQALLPTGDVGVWKENGQIVLFERPDRQVNIKGCRINLCEIERELLRAGAVAAHVFYETVSPEGRLLEAFILRKKEVGVQEYLDGVKDVLRFVFLPLRFYEIDPTLYPEASRTRDGLAKISTMAVSNAGFISEDPVCQKVYQIWSDILKTDKIGLDSNFFELGGNSYLVTLALEKIRAIFPVELTIMDLYRYATLEKIAQRITYLCRSKNVQ